MKPIAWMIYCSDNQDKEFSRLSFERDTQPFDTDATPMGLYSEGQIADLRRQPAAEKERTELAVAMALRKFRELLYDKERSDAETEAFNCGVERCIEILQKDFPAIDASAGKAG